MAHVVVRVTAPRVHQIGVLLGHAKLKYLVCATAHVPHLIARLKSPQATLGCLYTGSACRQQQRDELAELGGVGVELLTRGSVGYVLLLRLGHADEHPTTV